MIQAFQMVLQILIAAGVDIFVLDANFIKALALSVARTVMYFITAGGLALCGLMAQMG